LNTLVNIAQKQGGSIKNLKANIPFGNNKLKENLALIYFKQGNFEEALKIIEDIKKSTFTEDLTLKISDSIEKRASEQKSNEVRAKDVVNTNPLEELKAEIENLINTNDLDSLTELSNEALENYPSQPYFYYANGYALNKKGNHEGAVEVLETALDYMLDDVPLLNKIYQELVDAYTALNDSSKANTYLRKIKPGF
jgi:tetratricopeptide (TPR) repeat protein